MPLRPGHISILILLALSLFGCVPAADAPPTSASPSSASPSSGRPERDAQAPAQTPAQTFEEMLVEIRNETPVPATASHPLPAPSASRLSAGCNGVAPSAPPQRLTVAGRERDLIAVVPESYTPTTPHALVVAFHGRTNSNAQVRRYYRLETNAENTLFLYPAALPQGNAYSWSGPGDPADALRDYAFFDTMLATYAEGYCLDLDRIFVVGHSLGAWFANSLACARGDAIRAVATLGGGVSASTCRGSVAAMVLHNPDDRLVAVARGEEARDLYLAQNALASAPAPSEPAAFNCLRYADTRYPVLWCPHPFDHSYGGRYYPHNWPQGTGEVIMKFFGSLE